MSDPSMAPDARVLMNDDVVTVNGREVTVTKGSKPHEVAIAEVAATVATALKRPAWTVALDGGQETGLWVHPDGTAEAHTGETPAGRRVATQDRRAATGAAPTSQSFLTEHVLEEPATRGFRGLLTRLGWAQRPSADEQAERTDIRTVSQNWTGPRTIAIANPKGGVGKTPTVANLASVFARNGGAGVCAWDTNHLRGTLGWQTQAGTHRNHVMHLLEASERLMLPTARIADLASYVHHQTADRYDVLRSVPDRLARDQRITVEDFDRIHRVLSKYYRLIIIDSGNDESAEVWAQMIARADQLVVPTTTSPKSTEAARLMLQELSRRDEHSRRLAADAVVLVAQVAADDPTAASIAARFDEFARCAVTVPTDPALRADWLRHEALKPATRRSYLRGAAAVSEGL